MLVHGNPHSAVLRVHNKVEWVVDARKLDVLLIEALVAREKIGTCKPAFVTTAAMTPIMKSSN